MENEFQKNENISLAQAIIEDGEEYRRRNGFAEEEYRRRNGLS
jgi:hypothetical protein